MSKGHSKMDNKIMSKKINSKKMITIYTGEEYKLHIADENSNYNEDLFYETYKKAFKEVIKIISDNKRKDNNILDLSNNIIAFCGERGQGKSSAMISFSKILENAQSKNVKEYFKEYSNTLDNKTFFVIKRIDPTELENQQSILNVILSRIFFVFKDEISKNKIDDFYEKNEILKLFQKCFKSVNLIKENKQNSNESWFGDDLELLSSLGDNAVIKNNLSELINKFLHFVVKKDYLIIQIDDSDLNVKNAYSIAEDIRKYLMIPNVIILMATKPEQFNIAVEQEYAKSFKLLADAEQIPYQEFYQMATKYISKLIPGTRKINLPDLSLYSDTEEFDYHLKYIQRGSSVEYNEIIIDSDLQTGLLDLIYKKTGLIFIAPSNYTHNIVPNTMRELVNLLSVLNNLDDLIEYDSFEEMNSEYIIKRISNLQVFEKYFLDSWIEENVDSNYHKCIRDWYNSSWKIKNSLLIYYLSEILKKIPNTITVRRNQRSYSETETTAYNNQLEKDSFSYGNSLNNLDNIDLLCPLIDNYRFTFAIRILYSINLNKFILQRILAEKNRDYNKIRDIPQFIGSIFGNKINDYVPRRNGNIDRAFFHINMSANDSEKFQSVLSEEERIVLDLFFNNKITNSREEPIQYTFDISMPIIKILLHNSTMPLSSIFYNENYQKLRYVCFRIISNTDVLHKIKNSLSEKTYFNKKEEYLLKYIDNFYFKISNTLKEIKNFRLNVNFDEIVANLLNSSNIQDFIYNRGFLDKNELIKEFLNDLEPYINTKTTDILNDRMEETKRLFNRIYNFGVLDTSGFLVKLDALEQKRNSSSKLEIKESTCLEYQAKINKLRLAVKKKLELMVE